MAIRNELIVVFGATGQQGGATAAQLVEDGWKVRAFVRDVTSAKARALAEAGIELASGDLRDRTSIDAAVRGAYGVFSVQPSEGQPEYGISSDDELQIGKSVADAAKVAGVRHLVYMSMGGLRAGTGVGHFESKWGIEQHIRSLGVRFTILRPVAFMELLLQPHFGLPAGHLTFFGKPDAPFQFIAVEDIGKYAALVFADPETHAGKTFDIAGDVLTGNELAAKIGKATRRPITYAQFSAETRAQSPMLARLVELVDEGSAKGDADLASLRRLHPGVLSLDAWLEKTGRQKVEALFRA